MSQPKSYRVLISTDLGGDPDDMQSMVHLLHYSELFEIEGILSTTGPGSTPSAELVSEWVQRVDLDYLRGNGYPELTPEAEILDVVRQGAIRGGAPTSDGATPGSEWLIHCANQERDECLWVLVWGSMTDVAQALHDDPGIANRIRIYSIGSSNTTHDPESRDYVFEGMKDKWPNLWWIENGILPRFAQDTFRGYYTGGEQSGEWGNKGFIDQIIRPRGTTNNGKFSQTLGEAFPVATWPEGTLKEGDTPTFLYLLSPIIGKVGHVDDPTQESWGGQFRRPEPETYPNYACDLDASAEECQATINKWRLDYLGDWKKRWARYD